MKGILILIIILVLLGIWWARRTPDTTGNLGPEVTNGAETINNSTTTNQSQDNNFNTGEFEDKG